MQVNETEAHYHERVASYQLHYWIPFTWVGFVVCSISFVTTVAYRKQRIFPINLVSVTLFLDIMKFVKEIFKWTIFQESFVWYPSDAVCRFSAVYDSFVSSGQAINSVFMALVVYLAVVEKEELNYQVNPKYMLGMIVAFWVWVLPWSIVAGNLRGFKAIAATCNPLLSAPDWNYAQFGEWAVVVLINGVLIIRSYRYASEVYKLASNHSNLARRDWAKLFLILRFISIIVSQTLPAMLGLAGNVYSALHGANSATLPPVLLSVTFACYLYDAIIIMILNRSLRRDVRRTYAKLRNISMSDHSTNSYTTNQMANMKSSASKKSNLRSTNSNSNDSSKVCDVEVGVEKFGHNST